MKFAKSLVAVAGITLMALAGGTTTAQADSCPSEESLLPYSKNDPPFQCAQSHWSGKKSLGSWQTKSWTKTISWGYRVQSHCKYKSSSDVSVAEAWDTSTYTATATNWATSTRHFAAGVLFTTGPVDSGGYSNGCESSQGQIKHSIQKITTSFNLQDGYQNAVQYQPVTFAGTMSPSDAPGAVYLQKDNQVIIDPTTGAPVGGKISNSKFSFNWVPQTAGTFKVKLAYAGDTSKCPTKEKTCGWSPKISGNKTVNVAPADPVASTATASGTLQSAPPSIGETVEPATADEGARISSDTRTGIATLTRSAKMPAGLALSCPAGSVPLHAELYGGNTGRLLKYSGSGAKLRPGAIAGGRKAHLQLTCREKGKSAFQSDRIGFGTKKGDRMKTRSRGAMLFGGPGADRLVVRSRAGVAHGGLGGDRISVRGRSGVATGGPGADVIRSRAKGRSLLVGGPGRDRLVTSKARTLVDARDGRRDVVICRGDRSVVKADASDVIRGDCRVLD
jgi:hypothetical protein